MYLSETISSDDWHLASQPVSVVASLTEASGIPYIEKLAKVTVAIMELLEQRGKNKKDIKALCESIVNTVVVINTMVTMHEEMGAVCFKDVCAEMEEYLTSLAQDLKGEIECKHTGIKGFFKTKDLQDAIQDYRIHVNDLKTDFLVLFRIQSSAEHILTMAFHRFTRTQREPTLLMAEIQNKEDTPWNGEFVILIAGFF
ncbi:hypothetical protein ARMGADRAFT_1037174 [Armillaria gallica]|uniref:Uncharacterized protein n=1 Tax=Armillaria gallica TaxID=47427 RepID=A0A2H3CN56_ARMGA|nr:hypothetical protein ARMGADRAFT_1037174 [Armillaria gallica]